MYFSLPGGRGGHVKQVQEGGQHRLHPARPTAQESPCHHRPLDVFRGDFKKWQCKHLPAAKCQMFDAPLDNVPGKQ